MGLANMSPEGPASYTATTGTGTTVISQDYDGSSATQAITPVDNN